ncbi:chromobox protein homolog 3-like [Saccostrea echinata]|uniref:chromobox protein homolog 3-like n=1 Tax=Saccostrea echinata TaxID=191078 RepID=UPI002A80A078|nr:chromobox protein homolog 3-like [Saccostrea echinata]
MRKMTKQKGKSKGKESKAKQKKMAFDDNEPGFYYVDEILSERKKNGKSEFLIKWEGYEDPMWEPERNIPTHLIEEFKNV